MGDDRGKKRKEVLGSEDLESVEVISTLYPEDVSFRLRAKFEARISAVLASSIKVARG